MRTVCHLSVRSGQHTGASISAGNKGNYHSTSVVCLR